MSWIFWTLLVGVAPDFELAITCEQVEGEVYVAVFDSQDTFMDDRAFEAKIPVSNSTVTTTFSLPSGTYAISVFQDLNGNGELDTNIVGIPTEPYGFSNNARGRFGPPSFEDCQFQVPANSTMTIELK